MGNSQDGSKRVFEEGIFDELARCDSSHSFCRRPWKKEAFVDSSEEQNRGRLEQMGTCSRTFRIKTQKTRG